KKCNNIREKITYTLFFGILIFCRHVFATMSFIAETFIFLYVGMDALDIEKLKMTQLSYGNLVGIYSPLILLILLGRAAFVFPLSTLANYTNTRATSDRASSITFKHQVSKHILYDILIL
ncbi:Sodium/hydrogen exchanger 4, partial [Glycine soja]